MIRRGSSDDDASRLVGSIEEEKELDMASVGFEGGLLCENASSCDDDDEIKEESDVLD